jgi:hypothetical protein
MNIVRVLAIIALLCAAFSVVVKGFPLLVVAAILLAINDIIRPQP